MCKSARLLGVWLRTSAQSNPSNVTEVHHGRTGGRPNPILARMNTRGRLARCTVCGHRRNPSASDHHLVGWRRRSCARRAALVGVHAEPCAQALAGPRAEVVAELCAQAVAGLRADAEAVAEAFAGPR